MQVGESQCLSRRENFWEKWWWWLWHGFIIVVRHNQLGTTVMAYIRTKKVKGKEYRYRVEGYRDEHNKVKQRILEYLGPVREEDKKMVTTGVSPKISFEEYLIFDDGTNALYELVNGELVKMPPASFLHSDIIDFIADLIKAVVRENRLDIKVKTGDVGVRTGIDSSRIPDLCVIDGQVWKSYQRNKSAVIESGVLLASEVVSPGKEQIERDYTEKVAEYQNVRIPEYWIVDPMKQKITVLVLNKKEYSKTVFGYFDTISSPTFPQLNVTAGDILEAKV